MRQRSKPDHDPWAPRLEELENPGKVVLSDGVRLRNVQVSGEDWTGCEVNHVDMEGVHLRRTCLSEAKLSSLRAWDTRFEDCDLSAADFTECSLFRVEFRGCKMPAFTALAARFEWVRFIDCRLEMSLFRGMEAEDCRFESCDMRSADFEMASLKRLSVAKCRLGEASFRQARLEEADLRSSDLTGVRYVVGLKGAVIDQGQLFDIAASLAAESGIVVSE